MTNFCKVSLNEVWEKRKLNCFSKTNANLTPTQMGNGIFVKTQEGDVVFDLRSVAERGFLGHCHPILLKIAPSDSPVAIKGTIKPVEWLDKHDCLEFDEKKVLQSKSQCKTEIIQSDAKYIVERNLSLLSTQDLFHFPKYPNKARVWRSDYYGFCFVEGEESTLDNNQARFILEVKSYLETFIEPKILGKNSIDIEFIDKKLKELEFHSLSRKGRYLITSPNLNSSQLVSLSRSLELSGVLHSKSDTMIFMSFPLACLHSEIEEVLILIKKVLKEVS